jgi:hypothetical protein
MARPESIAIERHMTAEELHNQIKSLEKDVKVLQRGGLKSFLMTIIS